MATSITTPKLTTTFVQETTNYSPALFSPSFATKNPTSTVLLLRELRDVHLYIFFFWLFLIALMKFVQIEDPHIVDVDGKLFSARHILISVGERPFIRDISGSEYAIDSDAALDLPSKPEKTAICWWWQIHCLGISWHLQWSKK